MAVERSVLNAALASDDRFIARLGAMMANMAKSVRAEPGNTANHAARLAYANAVLRNPRAAASSAAQYIVLFDNFANQDITSVSGWGTTITTTDANGEGNIFGEWDALTAVFGS